MWHGVAGWLLPVARSAVPAGTYTGEAAANLRTAVVEGAGGCSGQNTRWAKGTNPSLCRPRGTSVKRMLSARAPAHEVGGGSERACGYGEPDARSQGRQARAVAFGCTRG